MEKPFSDLCFWEQRHEKTVLRARLRTRPLFGIQRGAEDRGGPGKNLLGAAAEAGGGGGKSELVLETESIVSEMPFLGTEAE